MPGKLVENTLHLVVVVSKCHHCGACVAVCPENALFLWDTRLEIISGTCTVCARCLHTCPVAALVMESAAEG